jgi:hypothetical protein
VWRNLDDEIVECSAGILARDLKNQIAAGTGLKTQALSVGWL